MHFSDVNFSLIMIMMIKVLIYLWSTISMPTLLWPDYLLSFERASLCGFYHHIRWAPGCLSVLGRRFTFGWCQEKQSLLCTLVSMCLCWWEVCIHFFCFSFFNRGNDVLYLGTPLHGLADPYGQWSHLVMSFSFFPTNVPTIMLCNNTSQTSHLT